MSHSHQPIFTALPTPPWAVAAYEFLGVANQMFSPLRYSTRKQGMNLHKIRPNFRHSIGCNRLAANNQQGLLQFPTNRVRWLPGQRNFDITSSSGPVCIFFNNGSTEFTSRGTTKPRQLFWEWERIPRMAQREIHVSMWWGNFTIPWSTYFASATWYQKLTTFICAERNGPAGHVSQVCRYN